MRHWLLRLFAGSVLTLGLILPVAASAETVTNWQDQLNVANDGTVKVVETITYDPQDNSHHGIERTIPAIFMGDGHTYYTWVQPISVTDQSGTPYNINNETVNHGGLYLQIGDANATISGPHTYVITYTIAPLIQSAGDHDRLIFNLVGTNWRTDIQAASVTVHYDNGTKVSTATCYTGVAGSTGGDCLATTGGGDAKATLTSPLLAYTAFTIDLTTPPNSVSSYLQPDKPIPLTPQEWLSYILSVATGVTIALAVLLMIVRKLSDWSRRRRLTVIAQYESPDNLKPAQLNMIDSYKQPKVIASTLIDLAVRGYLKIDLISPKSIFAQANYRFTALKTSDGLDPYEDDLFNVVFTTGNIVEMKTLRNQSFQMNLAITKLRKHLGTDLKAKGYFYAPPASGITTAGRYLPYFATIGLVIGFIFITQGSAGSAWILSIVFIVSLTGLWFNILHTGRTRLGDEEWAKIEGFKLFLRVTEKDRLAFTDAPAKTPQLFSALLPAAIALGVEKEWADQFAGIDVGPAVNGWYGGYSGVLLANNFGPDFSSSFSSAVSTNFAGASGGGGAAGGGGGGGGGGW